MPLRLDDVGARGRAPTRGAPTVGLFARAGEGTHEGCTYGWIICAHGGGHPRGVHIRLDDVGARGRAPTRGAHTVGLFARTVGWRGARGRAPTRGAPTVGLFARAGEGTHEGCTYGWVTWARGGGHPRGVPLRLDYLRARGRAPTRGAPTVGLFAWARGGGHPRGVPLRLDYLRARGEGTHEGGWVAHTVGWRGRAGEGTHEGCPYGWIICARGEGTHEGWPCGWIIRARARGGGHPQGVPLRLGYQTS